MSCFHPLLAYARIVPGTGKRELVFVDSQYRDIIEHNGHWYNEKLKIPCGQCVGCRLEYSRQWAIRCVLEAQQHENNYFLTLTYDDLHVPIRDHHRVDPETGEVLDSEIVQVLVPDDLTKFMKDLRRQVEYHFGHTGVRFFACGEYGDKTKRPHFHVILFNMPRLNDLVLYKRNFENSCLYNSAFIDKIWNKGYSVIGEVNFKTCAYVARYIMKKHKGKDSLYYDINGLVPEFTRCSRRPGIARDYYDEKRDHIYKFDELVISDKDGKALRVRPPQYYDRLYDVDCHDLCEFVKLKRRQRGENSEKIALSRTSLSAAEYLALKEGNVLSKISSLTRDI